MNQLPYIYLNYTVDFSGVCTDGVIGIFYFILSSFLLIFNVGGHKVKSCFFWKMDTEVRL
ncbi:MAG: hypothetical protein LN569_03545 [Rickettsia endosymbiont of Labidopullus appendiculatus]|nr:hypothetical protein [Rickettsia endosymbiont of Labidopullus appendiculatus]